jgi:hypothetical protein
MILKRKKIYESRFRTANTKFNPLWIITMIKTDHAIEIMSSNLNSFYIFLLLIKNGYIM